MGDNMTIKQHPELRHFLIHVLYALEELVNGKPDAALYEIKGIEGLVCWEDDDDFRKYCEGRWKHGKMHKEKAKKAKKVPLRKVKK